MSLNVFGLLEEAYAEARKIDNQRLAAMEAGQKLDETVRTQSQTIIELTRQRNKYKGTLGEQDAIISDLRFQLEDANGTIVNQQAEIIILKAQLENLGQRLDSQRSKRTPPPTGPAHGSIAIDSPNHKDNSPRN